ncbi:ribbon-helix-helix protein, CopG family [archaeon]|nr:ribbon-helix-helix protein, CopG family [archaeon]
MTMNVVPIRLPDGLIKQVDDLVDKGLYSSRSDVVRDALRKLVWRDRWKDIIGIASDTGDSVKEMRKIKKKLSKNKIDLDELNSL